MVLIILISVYITSDICHESLNLRTDHAYCTAIVKPDKHGEYYNLWPHLSTEEGVVDRQAYHDDNNTYNFDIVTSVSSVMQRRQGCVFDKINDGCITTRSKTPRNQKFGTKASYTMQAVTKKEFFGNLMETRKSGIPGHVNRNPAKSHVRICIKNESV